MWSKKAILWKNSKFHIRKIKFWSFWGHFSQRINFSQGGGGIFPLVHSKGSFWTESWAFQLVSKKVFHFSAKVPILALFDYPGPPSKSISSKYRQNFEKSLAIFLGEVVRHTVLNFQLSIFKKVRGGASRFACRHSPKSVNLISCYFVGRPFVACYACSIVILHSRYW